MEKSGLDHPLSWGVAMNGDHTAALVEAFRGLNAKLLAVRVNTSPRTTEKWLAGTNAPTWKHTVAMLNDDELAVRLLKAAGRLDLARSAETIARLKAVIVSEGGLREIHEENQERAAARREALDEIAAGITVARSDAGRSRVGISGRIGGVEAGRREDGDSRGEVREGRDHAPPRARGLRAGLPKRQAGSKR